MRERVNLVGGSLEIRANTPHGTLVRATLRHALPEPQPDAPQPDAHGLVV